MRVHPQFCRQARSPGLARWESVATIGAIGQANAASAQDDPFSVASSSLHDGAQTVCDLPATLRVPISERGRCLPHMKQDMVAPPNDAAAAKGEPEALDL
jgi:hypothetical protein